jgi:ornithine cyclodeaminase/alanine dehydrogenase-like protein (mu-crystallin family)
MLYIGKKQIEQVVDLEDIMDCVERAFGLYESGNYQMPERMHVDRPEGTILYMPCFAGEVSGTKIVSTFPGNVEFGVPTIQGTMILNNCGTGEALAIMDGATITAYRTGAVGGVGIRYTSRPDCTRVGLVGAGVQGLFQLLYACHTRPIEDIYIFDTSAQRAEQLEQELEKRLPHIKAHIARDVRHLVEQSEIIITATPSTIPVLPDDETLLRGKHFVAIGSYKYEMRELPPALFRVLDQVYVDSELALEESGDLIVPMENGWLKRDDIIPFGKVIDELRTASRTHVATTLFKSVGMGLFDLLVAQEIYNAARKKGVGIELGE